MIDEAQKAQTSKHFIVLSRRAMFHVTLCENRNLVKAPGKSYILGSSTHRAFFLTSLLSSWLCSQASIFRCQEKEKNMEVLKNSLFFFFLYIQSSSPFMISLGLPPSSPGRREEAGVIILIS